MIPARKIKPLVDDFLEVWMDELMDKIERTLPWIAIPLAAYVITKAIWVIMEVG